MMKMKNSVLASNLEILIDKLRELEQNTDDDAILNHFEDAINHLRKAIDNIPPWNEGDDLQEPENDNGQQDMFNDRKGGKIVPHTYKNADGPLFGYVTEARSKKPPQAVTRDVSAEDPWRENFDKDSWENELILFGFTTK